MALSSSASIQGHRVDVLLSLIDPLSIESYHFLAILILAKTTEMQVRERTMVQNIENGDNSPKHPWPTGSRADPGLKDWVLRGVL
jgi:hypothetical protein